MRQGQSLALTPQLLQSIRVLQMSAAELEAFVDGEAQENPLVERVGADGGDTDLAAEWPMAGGGQAAVSELGTAVARPSGERTIGTRDSGAVPDGPDFQNITCAAPSLSAHLEAQIAAAFRHPEETALAYLLLVNLDECGYLTVAPEQLADEAGVGAERILDVLTRCRLFEPSGVFARSLAECLALQLADRGRLDPAMQCLLDNLDLLARRDLRSLHQACGVDEEDLAEMVAELRALDPKPGLAFGAEPAAVVVPDVLVRHSPRGGWIVELNDAAMPRVLVDRRYCAEIAAAGRPEARRFLDGCLRQASWLERCLDQRATTVLKVATEIVRHQDGFLKWGPAHLRPLGMKDVAAATGVHESTVSRAIANKLMETPCGTLAMRAFFSGGIASTADGEEHSVAAVRHRVRQLIEAEKPHAPLSDQAIAERLQADGIAIARRTVAKYREANGIPSSTARRRCEADRSDVNSPSAQATGTAPVLAGSHRRWPDGRNAPRGLPAALSANRDRCVTGPTAPETAVGG